jgi:hypothetical protein
MLHAFLLKATKYRLSGGADSRGAAGGGSRPGNTPLFDHLIAMLLPSAAIL